MSKRINFFLVHLFVSFMIALLAVIMVFYVWYPSPLAKANDVSHIFLMMLAIDIIVGPLLTLLIYKEGKKTLKFDLSVIILIQVSAFLYGFYTIAQGRPAWLVFYHDRFDQVTVVEISQKNHEKFKYEYKNAPMLGPKFVAVKFSNNSETRKKDTLLELSGTTLAMRPERYLPLMDIKDQIREKALNLELLRDFNSHLEIDKILKKYPTATAWLPLKTNTNDMVVLINTEKAEVIKIVDLRPWN
ncbi:TfpX/TfpZ family type IV pilin accessory protein [Acinetobacter terrestris]|uniref:TfpX/TfpZ family type IV pilin accessory protein n=1 Tax=Acinetobacter terrestris TaxID=2529843 RepID=UPI00103B1BC7|nr:TfpX/TfpZ family type IV pilin accessory protein [Acinetobacter terrestris]TCB56501.1 type IV pilin accessory protein [Acinetobacter terrestris]